MLRFFKVNDPYRLLFLLILALLLRIPFYWDGITILTTDLNYMLVGEKLSGDVTLYKDLLTNIGPFSAFFFTTIHYLFGKSILAYHIIGFILMFFQAVFFNRIALINKIYTENNFLPAVIYFLLMSVSGDMFSVNEAMLSNTFILLAIKNTFGQIEFRAKRDEKILNIGIYLGVASLFYFPSIFYGAICILGLILFSSTIFRRYLLILFGLFLPFFIVATYYFFTDNLWGAIHVFLNSWFEGSVYQISLTSIILLCIPSLVFLLFSIYKVTSGPRFSSYQARIAQFMIFWLVLSSLILLKPVSGLSGLMLCIPGVAYFITHFFVLAKKNILAEIYFFSFSVLIVGLSYAAWFGWWGLTTYISYQPLVLQETPYDDLLNGRKIWVFGDNIHYYKLGKLGTKYYDWHIAEKSLFGDRDDIARASLIYEDIMANTPDIIIDQEEKMTAYLKKMPAVILKYTMVKKGVYVKKQGQPILDE